MSRRNKPVELREKLGQMNPAHGSDRNLDDASDVSDFRIVITLENLTGFECLFLDFPAENLADGIESARDIFFEYAPLLN